MSVASETKTILQRRIPRRSLGNPKEHILTATQVVSTISAAYDGLEILEPWNSGQDRLAQAESIDYTRAWDQTTKDPNFIPSRHPDNRIMRNNLSNLQPTQEQTTLRAEAKDQAKEFSKEYHGKLPKLIPTLLVAGITAIVKIRTRNPQRT